MSKVGPDSKWYNGETAWGKAAQLAVKWGAQEYVAKVPTWEYIYGRSQLVASLGGAMGGPTQTGSFWICPDCRKHVPSRIAECRCGFKRGSKRDPEATVNLGRPASADDVEKPKYLRTIAIAASTIGFLAFALYMSADAWWRVPAKDTDLARTLRERRAGGTQPGVVYVPGPSPAVSEEVRLEPDAPTSDPSAPLEEVTSPKVVADVAAIPRVEAPPPSAPPYAPEAFPIETETDLRRKAGIVEFERAMPPLSAKADQADIAWERYLAGCRQNITTATSSSVAVAGMASRDWIGIVGAASTSSVSIRTWTEACSEAGTFFALYDQVKHGMCVAEEAARRASVYPGTRRDIRTKYRLDWTGWDAFCR